MSTSRTLLCCPRVHVAQVSQRVATMLIYLTDVEEGGETIFPLEGKNGLERLNNIDYRSCEKGLKVRAGTRPGPRPAGTRGATDVQCSADTRALWGLASGPCALRFGEERPRYIGRACSFAAVGR
jgi:hypothetical protein